MTTKNLPIYLTILLSVIVYYLPVLISSNLLLARSNDLEEQFWPFFLFIKNQILTNNQFPLWINSFFSGMPLLPDPQFSLFYPFNWGFIIFPIEFWFIAYFLLHTILGGIGVYFLGKFTLKISRFASVIMSVFYIFSPQLSGFLEAGHLGLVATQGLIPWVFYLLFLALEKKSFKYSLFFALVLALIFFAHTVIFIIIIFSVWILIIINFFISKKDFNKKTSAIKMTMLGFLLCFGFIAVGLLPQLEWIPETSRTLLLKKVEVYPMWRSVKEVFSIIFAPWILGTEGLQKLNAEKWVVIGVSPLFIAGLTFLKLTKRNKLILASIITILTLIILNNKSPIFHFLISQEWFLLMRVTTRVWVLVTLILTILVGLGVELLTKKKFVLLSIFVTIILLEELALSWIRLLTPPSLTKYVPSEVYSYLSEDKSQFRVFCLVRCLSQKKVVEYELETVEGYNTLQQLNYFHQMWQFTNHFWDYYTLSLPPVGIYRYSKIVPDLKALSEYNVKYIISIHPLSDKNLELRKIFGDYLIYQNLTVLPRAYFHNPNYSNIEVPIIKYTPNFIRVDTKAHKSNQIILAEVYSKGWNAYLNGQDKKEVLQRPNALRLVNISKDTNFVDLKYEPRSFQIGGSITLVTVFLTLIVFPFKKNE